MKTLFTLLSALAIVAARAQTSTTTAASANVTGQETFRQSLPRQPGEESRLFLPPTPVNEIRSDRFAYQGILVQLYKTRAPLELINPVSEYGTAWDNVAFDQVNGQLLGWKFFSIGF